jgi:hypothetical protein
VVTDWPPVTLLGIALAVVLIAVLIVRPIFILVHTRHQREEDECRRREAEDQSRGR